jgi:opacity protein-like surface antigen
MKKYLIFLLLVICQIGAFSQEKHSSGFLVGLNMAKVEIDPGDGINLSSLNGVKAGFFTDFDNDSKHFFTRIGLFYAQKGTTIEALGTSVEEKLHYVELPLTFNFRAGIDPVNFYAGIGGFAGYAFSGKMNNEKIDIGFDAEKNDINPIDMGLQFGGGLQYELDKITIELGTSYQFGLWNIKNNVENAAIEYKVNSRVLEFHLGFLF